MRQDLLNIKWIHFDQQQLGARAAFQVRLDRKVAKLVNPLGVLCSQSKVHHYQPTIWKKSSKPNTEARLIL